MATESAAKAKTTKATKAKPAAAKAAPEAVVIDAEGTASATTNVRLKDLIERVIAATDHNRKDVKHIIESALDEIAKGLIAAEAMILPPLGRLRVVKTSTDDDGVSMTVKLRKVGEKQQAKTGDKETLAEPGEAS